MARVLNNLGPSGSEILDKLSKLFTTIGEVQSGLASVRSDLQGGLARVRSDLQGAGVHLLNASDQYVFVNHGTGERNDSDIQNMGPDGATIYCGEKVPAKANGVIIAVLLVGTPDRQNALFVCSDANGSFYEPLNGQAVNGIYNYSGTWMGGILFCPFVRDTKQFKYLVGSSKGTPDTTTRCRGVVIGWF